MKLFVFGSLKRGEWAAHKLETSLFLGEGITEKLFAMVDVGYPMIVPVEDGAPVKGELYEITPEVLSNCDRYEGYPSHYTRELMTIRRPDDTECLAWIYFNHHLPAAGVRTVPDDHGLLRWFNATRAIDGDSIKEATAHLA